MPIGLLRKNNWFSYSLACKRRAVFATKMASFCVIFFAFGFRFSLLHGYSTEFGIVAFARRVGYIDCVAAMTLATISLLIFYWVARRPTKVYDITQKLRG